MKNNTKNPNLNLNGNANSNGVANGAVDGTEKSAKPAKASLFLSSRLSIVLMAFLGCLLTYVLRLNLGFALVCMVHKKEDDNLNDTNDKCWNLESHHTNSSTTDYKEKEFNWDKSLQGILLSSFFYGYIITQVPAGWLCDKIGGKIVVGTGMAVLSLLTLAIPEASRLSPYFLLAVRVVQGMFAAVSFPAFHSLIGTWAPTNERGLLLSIAYSGMHVGSLVTFPVSGLLCDYGFDGGWPSVFYVTGLFGFAWVFALFFVVYDNPQKHPRISEKEKTYLEHNSEHSNGTEKKKKIPWKRIIKSGPVWAISVAHLSSNWGVYTLIINLPTYMTEVHKFKIKENGFLSSLPYLCTLFLTLICGKLSDFLLKRKILNLTALRKTFNSIGMLIPCVCMFVLTYLDCTQRYTAVGVITLLQSSTAFAYSGGFFYNHVDIAPQYAGILMGITNMFGTIPGILTPLLVGILTPDGTLGQWSIVFYIAMGSYALGGGIYLVLASGERQPWASLTTDSDLKSEIEMQSHDDPVQIRSIKSIPDINFP